VLVRRLSAATLHIVLFRTGALTGLLLRFAARAACLTAALRARLILLLPWALLSGPLTTRARLLLIAIFWIVHLGSPAAGAFKTDSLEALFRRNLDPKRALFSSRFLSFHRRFFIMSVNEGNGASLKEDLRAVRDDTQKLASDAYSVARDTAEETVDNVRMQGEELLEQISDYVANKPLTSLGIAAAAGFILAKLWGR
jgi:ElaB/YqjD/DUF883 family membrane-anchored ribosome-binding protein